MGCDITIGGDLFTRGGILMGCDICNGAVDLYVVTPRPSCPEEIVSVMAFCFEHPQGEQATLDDFDVEGWAYLQATKEVLYDYIESEAARKNRHLWLTI